MPVSISSNTSSIVAELGKVGKRAYYNVEAAVTAGGKQVETDWIANATQTAGTHGRWYPLAIKGRKTAALEYSIEPDDSARQGAMSFEYGSQNQAPHLDALRAFDGREMAIRRRIARAVSSAV